MSSAAAASSTAASADPPPAADAAAVHEFERAMRPTGRRKRKAASARGWQGSPSGCEMWLVHRKLLSVRTKIPCGEPNKRTLSAELRAQ